MHQYCQSLDLLLPLRASGVRCAPVMPKNRIPPDILLLEMAEGMSDQVPLAAEPLRSQAELVLVVEDDERLRRLLAKQLRALGYGPIEAECGERALELLKSRKPVDLRLMDVVMPSGIDGRQFAGEATKVRPGLKIVLTSGFLESLSKLESPLQRLEMLLRKPYRRNELAQTLRSALQNQTACS